MATFFSERGFRPRTAHFRAISARASQRSATATCRNPPSSLCSVPCETVRALLPPLDGSHEVHRLYHRDPQPLQEIVFRDLLPASGPGEDGQREAHRVQDSVGDGTPVTEKILVHKAPESYGPDRGILVGAGEHRHRLPSMRLYRSAQLVDRIRVPACVEDGYEQHEDDRTSRPPDI